mgnify:CR=1 FL=1
MPSTDQLILIISYYYYAHLEKQGSMVLISDGNSDYVSHEWSKIGLFRKYPMCDCSRSNQMPWPDQITVFIFLNANIVKI